MSKPNLALARLWYQRADAIRWRVARIAAQVVGSNKKGMTLEMAEAIGRKVDTVEALARAYELFGVMVRNEWMNNRTSVSIRKLRRDNSYTRWATVHKMWTRYEFSIDEAAEWIRDFEGGNLAMSLEIENKYGDPEWMRRAYNIRKEAFKLKFDMTAPFGLVVAAGAFCDEYDVWVRKGEQL